MKYVCAAAVLLLLLCHGFHVVTVKLRAMQTKWGNAGNGEKNPVEASLILYREE